MCDPTPIRNRLILVTASLVGAAAAIVTAAAMNGSFWAAPGAPIPMGIAAALTGAAILALSSADDAMNSFAACMGGESTKICKGTISNFENALTGMKTVLGLQLSSCISAALIAYIPWVGQPAMWVILGALVLQIGLIPLLIHFANAAIDCLNGKR